MAYLITYDFILHVFYSYTQLLLYESILKLNDILLLYNGVIIFCLKAKETEYIFYFYHKIWIKVSLKFLIIIKMSKRFCELHGKRHSSFVMLSTTKLNRQQSNLQPLGPRLHRVGILRMGWAVTGRTMCRCAVGASEQVY